MAPLEEKLSSALKSRDDRQMRRTLPSNEESLLVDFSSNDYLSLSKRQDLRSAFITKLDSSSKVLGSGGSRLLINGPAHTDLETRLKRFFGGSNREALLFNSGFDANVGFFSCVPQPGDVIVHDEYIHASVHDGIRASRARSVHFAHNSMADLERVLFLMKNEQPALRCGEASVFLAVESLYSMDGTVTPLTEMTLLAESMFPKGNAYLVIDEAHATGIYGPLGRGLVSLLGLEDRVFVRLHTFGKALASNGAVIITTPLVKDYLLNYARPLIYTTSLSHSAIIQINCAFDVLESGKAQKLSNDVLYLSQHLVELFKARLHNSPIQIPLDVISLPSHLYKATTLPSPIIPLMTSYPRPLSAYLQSQGFNIRPITWPTVPKGKERVRVCLHSGNSRKEVELLVDSAIAWALASVVAIQGRSRSTEAKM